MPRDFSEEKTRLPIMLLVASGYCLGLILPISRPARLRYWGGVAVLFGLLFYAGRHRLLEMINEVRYRQPVELTKADEWFEKFVRFLVRFVALSVVIFICVSLGVAAFIFATDALGWNLYVSVGTGVFIFWCFLSGTVGNDGLIDAPKWWDNFYSRWFRSKDSGI